MVLWHFSQQMQSQQYNYIPILHLSWEYKEPARQAHDHHTHTHKKEIWKMEWKCVPLQCLKLCDCEPSKLSMCRTKRTRALGGTETLVARLQLCSSRVSSIRNGLWLLTDTGYRKIIREDFVFGARRTSRVCIKADREKVTARNITQTFKEEK